MPLSATRDSGWRIDCGVSGKYMKKEEISPLTDVEKTGYFGRFTRKNKEEKAIVFRRLNIFPPKVAALEKIPNFQAESLNRAHYIYSSTKHSL